MRSKELPRSRGTPPEGAPVYGTNETFSRANWDEVSDNPEMTDEELAQLRPGTEGMPPAMAAAFAKRGGRPKSGSKAG